MKHIKIGTHLIGQGHPTFIIAELSGNHNQDYKRAVKLIEEMARAGVDAIKLQTYTPDTMTLNSDKPWFRVKGKDIPEEWKGKTLYQLYQTAYTPWDWQPKLKKIAGDCGLLLFSAPFDETAVDFLERMDVPCYKIASYEMTDTLLLKKVASTKKPVIISRGMASKQEIALALRTLRINGAKDIVLLHCVSSYPAKPEDMNLLTIPDLRKRFNVITGLSDHSLGIEVALASVVLGAKAIEKHVTLARADGGPDSSFSLEPQEMAQLVRGVRNVEKALGRPHYGASGAMEKREKNARRSLWVVKDIRKGERFTKDNIRSVRPGYGLPVKYFETVIGKLATKDIKEHTPLALKMVKIR